MVLEIYKLYVILGIVFIILGLIIQVIYIDKWIVNKKKIKN